MAQALVDTLPDAVGRCEVQVLTTYPRQDRAERPEGVGLVSLRPVQLVFPVLPIALLVGLLRRLGGSGRGLAGLHPVTRCLSRADVVLDVAGISFVDGRSFPTLVYNVLMTGVPLLLGAPVVKCAQAIGPFETRLNRRAARAVLPRLRAVLTRGERTHRHAESLGLTNARRADDLAFLMKLPSVSADRAEQLLAERAVRRPFVAVAPSSVVKAYGADHGLDYPAVLAQLIQRIRQRLDVDVVLVPHSARPGKPESRMNDLPLCAEIHAAVDDPRTHLSDVSLRPAELRALIDASELLITSRFHAMISALTTSTPVLVIGWSHKYEEVLGEFGLSELVVPYDQLDPDELERRLTDVWERRVSIAERIGEGLPAVRSSAWTNLEVIREQLGERSSR